MCFVVSKLTVAENKIEVVHIEDIDPTDEGYSEELAETDAYLQAYNAMLSQLDILRSEDKELSVVYVDKFRIEVFSRVQGYLFQGTKYIKFVFTIERYKKNDD